jgi:hypothetical protein
MKNKFWPLLPLCCCAPAQAQVASATLAGSVIDPSGAAISGAVVTAAQPATGFSRVTPTDARAGDPRRMQFALRYDF